jgi:glycosyltransferase involved in cell wall biosynthesis
MYSGNLGLSQGLETVLDAAARLRSDRRIRFVFIGDGARRRLLEARARDLGLENLRFEPYRPRESLAESLSAADLHLIPLARDAAGCLVPSKVYGILAAGRPFVAIMDPAAEVARIAADLSVGFVVRPGDAAALAETIRRAADHPAELQAMGARARIAAVERYSRPIVTQQFAALLERVAAQPRDAA